MRVLLCTPVTLWATFPLVLKDPAKYTQMMMNIDPLHVTFANPLNNTKHEFKSYDYLETITTLTVEGLPHTQMFFTLITNFKKHGKT